MTARTRQRGFTLIEMMVVLAIIAVLATLAVANLKAYVRAIDVADRVSDMVHEASREAVTYGNVRSDVALALNSKARTRVIAYGSDPGGIGGGVTFVLQRLQEHSGDSGADWITVTSYVVDKRVFSKSWAPSVGSYATVSSTASTTWGTAVTNPTFTAPCYPDGTCDARTLFFEATSQTGLDYRARMSVMPLGGSTYTRQDWN
jgi:prepilin-type N-terminal cleavage/methylation domain-containing protein